MGITLVPIEDSSSACVTSNAAQEDAIPNGSRIVSGVFIVSDSPVYATLEQACIWIRAGCVVTFISTYRIGNTILSPLLNRIILALLIKTLNLLSMEMRVT